MSGVELIVAALAAGAAAGVTNTASAAVQEAYDGFKRILGRRLDGRDRAQQALQGTETAPGTWAALVGDDLAASGAAEDVRVLAAAQRLLALLEPPATVDLRSAKGVQVGDHNTQTNTFT